MEAGTMLNASWFKDMKSLVELSINNVKHIEIFPGTFSNLVELEHLSLYSCGLTDLPENVFKGLTNLTGLHLEDNHLKELSSQIFRDLYNLETLRIEGNEIVSLPEGIFDSLLRLNSLKMGYNRYRYIPENLFLKTTTLKYLRFVVNHSPCRESIQDCNEKVERLNLPSDFFQIPSIEVIEMLHVPLTSLPPMVFKGCSALQNLTLQTLYIDNLPKDVFANLTSLIKIDVSGNLLKNLTSGIFNGLQNLEVLRLKKNFLTNITDSVFQDLGNLKTLHLQENQIGAIHKNAFTFLLNLRELDLSSNILPYGGEDRNYYGIFNSQYFEFLVTLNLAHNFYSVLDNGIAYRPGGMFRLSKLNLSYNSLKSYNLKDFLIYDRSFIDLSYNKIEKVNFNEKYVLPFLYDPLQVKPKLNLIGNPLVCDCFTSELKEKIEGTSNQPVSRLFTLHEGNQLRCGPSLQPKLSKRLINSISYEDLICGLPSEQLPAETCPDKCSCSWNKHSQLIKVRAFINPFRTTLLSVP